MTALELPHSSSLHLGLVHPTEEEKLAIWRLNGKSWAGRLDIETYIRREKLLADQAFTRDNGITYWILTDTTKAPNEREILASCESLRKRALIATAERNGEGGVEEIVSHGIGSVFSDPRYRRRGYAGRMIDELAKKLDTWLQPAGMRADFTVLYSDIGKVSIQDEDVPTGRTDPWVRNSTLRRDGMLSLQVTSIYHRLLLSLVLEASSPVHCTPKTWQSCASSTKLWSSKGASSSNRRKLARPWSPLFPTNRQCDGIMREKILRPK